MQEPARTTAIQRYCSWRGMSCDNLKQLLYDTQNESERDTSAVPSKVPTWLQAADVQLFCPVLSIHGSPRHRSRKTYRYLQVWYVSMCLASISFSVMPKDDVKLTLYEDAPAPPGWPDYFGHASTIPAYAACSHMQGKHPNVLAWAFDALQTSWESVPAWVSAIQKHGLVQHNLSGRMCEMQKSSTIATYIIWLYHHLYDSYTDNKNSIWYYHRSYIYICGKVGKV